MAGVGQRGAWAREGTGKDVPEGGVREEPPSPADKRGARGRGPTGRWLAHLQVVSLPRCSRQAAHTRRGGRGWLWADRGWTLRPRYLSIMDTPECGREGGVPHRHRPGMAGEEWWCLTHRFHRPRLGQVSRTSASCLPNTRLIFSPRLGRENAFYLFIIVSFFPPLLYLSFSFFPLFFSLSRFTVRPWR